MYPCTQAKDLALHLEADKNGQLRWHNTQLKGQLQEEREAHQRPSDERAPQVFFVFVTLGPELSDTTSL